MKALEWQDNFSEPDYPPYGLGKGLRLMSFQRNWEAIVKEWSDRWGKKVHGWWIDGCYFPESMYLRVPSSSYQTTVFFRYSRGSSCLVRLLHSGIWCDADRVPAMRRPGMRPRGGRDRVAGE